MFITNPEKINYTMSFSKEVSDWLQLNKIPILSIKDNKYIFAKTNLLLETLKLLPDNLKGGENIE